VASYKTLYARMTRALREWPEVWKNENFPGTKYTYWDVAVLFQKTKSRKKLRPFLEAAVRNGFIRG